jgi:hypothetical protein
MLGQPPPSCFTETLSLTNLLSKNQSPLCCFRRVPCWLGGRENEVLSPFPPWSLMHRLLPKGCGFCLPQGKVE